MIRKVLCFLIAIPLSALGSSLVLKAGIGVGAWDAFSKSASSLIGMRVGTFSIFMNTVCILVQLIVLRKQFQLRHLMQFPMAFILGNLVNLFYYELLGPLSPAHYPISLILLMTGTVISAAAIGMIMALDWITFPVGGCVAVIAALTQKPFGNIRQKLDVLCIILVLTLVLTAHGELTLREGTLLNMALFGPLVDRFINSYRRTGLFTSERRIS